MRRRRARLRQPIAPAHPWVIERMVQRIPTRSGSAASPLGVWLILGVLVVCALGACLGVFLWSNGGFNVAGLVQAPTPSSTPVSARAVVLTTAAVPSPIVSPAPSPTATRAAAATPTSPPTATATRAPTATPTPLKYTVRSGDSLISIAARYKISVEDLRQANGLTSDLIRAGDELIIPRPTPTPSR